MSARSRDIISASLITAGIPMAAEVHLAAAATGGAFHDYWVDWFDSDKWHNSTRGYWEGYEAMTAGRNDVLMLGPGSHEVSTRMIWTKDDTHLVGGGGLQKYPTPLLQIKGDLSPFIEIQGSNVTYAGVTIRHGQDTNAVNTAYCALQNSTGSDGFTVRNCAIRGPDDATIAASTEYCLVKIHGNKGWWENVAIGHGGYAMAGSGTVYNQGLLKFTKAKGIRTVFKDCEFVMDSTQSHMRFIMWDYSAGDNNWWIFRNCQFLQTSSKSQDIALGSWTRAVNDQPFLGSGDNRTCVALFDANCVFTGVTDVGAALAEGCFKFAAHGTVDASGTYDESYVGLASDFDHTKA